MMDDDDDLVAVYRCPLGHLDRYDPGSWVHLTPPSDLGLDGAPSVVQCSWIVHVDKDGMQYSALCRASAHRVYIQPHQEAAVRVGGVGALWGLLDA